MKGLLKVNSVKEVPGFVPPFDDANRYNGSSLISRKNEYKALHITGEVDGKRVSFFSPTVCITHTSGFLNHSLCHNGRGWFKVEDGQQTAHRGAKMFDGGETPNVALDSHSKVIRLVNEGDEVEIKYSVKGGKNNVVYLSRVVLVDKAQ